METSQVQSVLPEGYILQAPANTYRIEKTLGMGGFGITYLATTTVQFGNLKTTISVAIKEHFISDSCERDTQTHSIVYSNPVKNRVEGSRRDFIAEARRLQKVGIEHPNIVKVNEVFETNNTAYYVMEYLEGKSLRAYVKQRGKLEENEMLALMRPIMSAVRLLHEHYMTHLDIKPDNIMLTTDEHGNARPVLIDFGLSKHYGKDGRPTSTINTLGCSDGYAPVEQYVGITTFSPSADIYALGATMLFCLTGKDPKKSVDFKEADKETLLNSLSLTDDTRRMLLNALQMDASKRSLSSTGQTDKKETETHHETVIIQSDSNDDEPSGRTIALKKLLYGGAAVFALVCLWFGMRHLFFSPSSEQDVVNIDSIADIHPAPVTPTSGVTDNENDIAPQQEAQQTTESTKHEAKAKAPETAQPQQAASPKQATEEDTDKVFDKADQMPTFPGGTSALMAYISKNLHYPTIAVENNIQGRVVCQFIVDKDGQVRNVTVVGKLDPDCDKEAVRVLSNMPKWNPGKINGKAVAVKYTIPISFRLS